MRCQQVQALFSEWQEQQLEPSLVGRMQAHLESCPVCAREWKEFQATWRVLHRLPEVEPPSDFVARTLAALPLSPQMGLQALPPLPGVLWRWAGVGGVLLALLGVGSLAFWLGTRPVSDDRAPQVAMPAPLRPAAGPRPVPEQAPQPSAVGERWIPREGSGRGRKAAPLRLASRPGKGSSRQARTPRKAPSAPSVSPAAGAGWEPFSRVLAQAQRSLAQGRPEAAAALLEPRLAQAPSDRLRAAGYRQLARAYQASYRLKEALEAVQQARRLDPQGTPPVDGLAQQVLAEARALLAEGQAEEAAQLSQALLTCQEGQEEQQAAAVALIARCQALQRQPELEQATWARLAQQYPASKPSAGALWQVAQGREQSGNAAEAAAAYQQLITQLPQEKEEWFLRARALKRAADLNARRGGDRQAVKAQYAAAQELFKRALREAPPGQDGTILLEMAQVQEALQQKQEAIETYVELLQQHPNTDSARQAEARLEELI